ncbi:MAG: DUF2207 family protein [Merdibacter sp.]
MQSLMALITLLPSLLFVWSMTYARFELWELSLRNLIPSLLLGFDLAGWVYLVRHRFTLEAKQFFARMSVLIIVACILLAINSVTLYLYGIAMWALVIYLFVTIVLFFCMLYMDKRTRKGNEWKAEILGIREFIETVEPEQLKERFQENPKLFTELLPFAYVLGLADIWGKKFERLSSNSRNGTMACRNMIILIRSVLAYVPLLLLLHGAQYAVSPADQGGRFLPLLTAQHPAKAQKVRGHDQMNKGIACICGGCLFT